MSDLSTTFMGIPLTNPIIVGACSFSKSLDSIRMLEDFGAGALVIKSLFEEQIRMEQTKFEEENAMYSNTFAEAVSMFPKLTHSGPKEHLYWIKKTRNNVKFPLIASLNAVDSETWVEYAKELENTGVNGLELNFYSPPLDIHTTSMDIEKRELEIVGRIRSEVKIPISIKLHAQYTGLTHHIHNLKKAGANSFVLFNRFFQPDINMDTLKLKTELSFSNSKDHLVPLKWITILHNQIKSEYIASTGIETGKDAAKLILAGATAVQVVSTIYKRGPAHISAIIKELESFMQAHDFKDLNSFRGFLSRKNEENVWLFERGQYIKAVVGHD